MTLGWSILLTSAKVVLDQRSYFEKYAHTSTLPADFRTDMIKYGRVGRPATPTCTNLPSNDAWLHDHKIQQKFLP